MTPKLLGNPARVDDRAETNATPKSPAVAYPQFVAAAQQDLVALLVQVRDAHVGIAADIKRIADALDPPPPNIIGTPEVAKRLGCTTTWIADLIRRGVIPASCLVPGSGNGKPWKFHRDRIEKWIATR